MFSKLINFLTPKKGAVIFVLGDPITGWIPSKEIMAATAELIAKTAIPKFFNVIIYHFGIDLAANNAVNVKAFNIDVKAKTSPLHAIYCLDYGKGADWTAIITFVKGLEMPKLLNFTGNAGRPSQIID